MRDGRVQSWFKSAFDLEQWLWVLGRGQLQEMFLWDVTDAPGLFSYCHCAEPAPVSSAFTGCSLELLVYAQAHDKHPGVKEPSLSKGSRILAASWIGP